MGFDNDKYPLPAPTESSTLDSADESIHIDDIDTNVSTNVSNRTDRTSYSVPDDGTPITINTTTPTKPHGGGTLHKKFPSQTSLLIEYFDTGSTDGQDQRRASVRVRITPSSRKSKKNLANDHIQISQASRNHRKPSSTRRISLASESRDELIDTRSVVFSDISALPPENTSFLPSFADDDDSDGGRYIPVPSDISSMPTDSMTGATEILPPARRRSRSIERDAVTDSMVSEAIKDTLKAPREQRSRSLSKDRITQRVMEKLQQQAAEGNLSSKSKERSSKSRETSRRRDDDLSSSRKSHRRRSKDVERVGGVSGTESSVLSSNIDRRSVVSGTSSINNPKLLATVEDAIKRLILPELNALKEENRTSRNVDKFERSNRDSTTLYEPAESTSSRDPSKRRVSKSSSTPKLHSNKPKVTLNRDNDDPAITLTGTSSRKSDRRSSRSSISSFAESTTREEKSHRRKSRDKEGLSQRESALLSLAGAGLTTAALKHHTSREEKEEERKHRKHRSSRSIRSRSESVSDSLHEEKRPKELVPPLPFNQSEMIGGSELTRDSILSAETETKERPESRSSASTGISGTGAETPLQQVPRGFASPSPLTPSRTPNALQQNLGSAHSNRSTGEFRQSTPKSERSYTSRQKEANDAGLSAAAAAKIRAIEQSQSQVSKYEIESDTQSGRGVSPIQSEASYRGDTTNTGSPRRFHSIRSGPSVSSLGDHFERRQSGLSIASLDSTASTKAARTRKRPQGVTLESKKSILNEPSTPTDTKEFFERNHKKNEQYRRELEENPLTPPPVNYNRLTQYTDDSVGGPDLNLNLDRDPKLAQDIRKVGSIPEYIHTPLAVESAVASLYDQTELSVRSSKASSPLKKSTLSQVSTNPAYVQTDNVPAGQRWAAIRDKAEALSQGNKVDNSPKQSIPREDSPRQSIAESEDAESIDEAPRMHHSAFPVGQDDMPEIGYGLDDQSDVTTNPSIIQGPIGGGKGYHDRTDELLHMQEERERTPTSFSKGAHLHRHEQSSPATFDDERQPTVEDDYDHPYPGETQYEQEDYAQSTRTPLSGQTGWKDEGYQSANHGEGYTPQNRKYSKMFEDDFGDDYDGMALGEDAFGAPRGKHDRQVSGNSHGIDSPLYDAATGKGIDHIQSKDIVALMDHLTVRDAQRNARDTEILVTLVRSAAEMRTQLDDLKQFIKVQDNMIMNTTDKRVNLAEQRILGGPRPQPVTPPRFNRNQSEEEIETKKKSVFRRALKGLSAGKGDGDIKHIEAMLVQLLGEVEGLKQVNQLSLDQQQQQQQQQQHQQQETARTNSMTSLENRRQSGDAGYEPEGRANTAESPNQSGYFSIPSSSRRIQDLHSGYDVGPTTRISTVREESDEEYDERSPGYENTERMTTPTQEAFQEKRASLGTPPQASRAARDSRDSRDSRELQSQENTPKRKHKSNSSSIFGIPKISRWSKTTASTNPESLPRNSGSGDKRPYSTHSIHSRSSSQDDYYDEEEPYAQHADDRLRSSTSLAREDQGSIRSVRSPSPLIPEENAYEMEDPKYQAHRNSLNLQHPQPRPGPTGRHQNNLETQAQIFQPTNRSSISSPDFDQWGSMPSLARNRLSGMSAPHASNLSPISSDGSYSQVSEHQNGSARQPKAMDDGPLMPPQQTLAGYGQTRQMYSSPNEFGSQGALTPLAPIAEVRYSLETDRGHRMTPTASSRASSASLRTMSDLSTPQRKITGPRAMGSRSPQPNSPLQHSDTVVRRKPIEDDLESLESYRSSLDSEIF